MSDEQPAQVQASQHKPLSLVASVMSFPKKVIREGDNAAPYAALTAAALFAASLGTPIALGIAALSLGYSALHNGAAKNAYKNPLGELANVGAGAAIALGIVFGGSLVAAAAVASAVLAVKAIFSSPLAEMRSTAAAEKTAPAPAK